MRKSLQFLGALALMVVAGLSASAQNEWQAELANHKYVVVGNYDTETCYVYYINPNYAIEDGVVELPTSVAGPNSVSYPVVGVGPNAGADLQGNYTTLKMGPNIQYLAESAFAGSTALTEIVFDDNLINIQDSAFSGCTALKSVTLPPNLNEIAFNPFAGCTALKEIKIADTNSMFESRDGVLFTKSNILVIYPAAKGSSYTIPAATTMVGPGAFASCSSLTNITLNEGLKSLGEKAFYSCTGLSKINIPSTLIQIGNAAFGLCKSLSFTVADGNSTFKVADGFLVDKNTKTACYAPNQLTLTFPDEVENIAAYACYGYNTKTVNLNNVKNVGEYAFARASVTTINSSKVENFGAKSFLANYFTSLTLPASTKSIGEQAFQGCSRLTSLTLNDGLESIGYCAFANTSISSVLIPGTVKEYGQYSFCQNSKLTSIEWAEGAQITGSGVCALSGTLTSVKLPSTMRTISEASFIDNTALKDINFNEGLLEIGLGAFQTVPFTEVKLSNTVRTLGQNAFAWCKQMTKFEGGQGLESLGMWSLQECKELSDLQLKLGLKYVGFNAITFTKLTTLDFPASTADFATSAIGGADYAQITDIYLRAYTPPVISKDLYGNISGICGDPADYSIVTLHVPYGQKKVYQRTDGWNLFAKIVEMEQEETAKVYLRNSSNGWNATEEFLFTTENNETFELHGVSLPKGTEFKIADADWAVYNYGDADTGISDGETYVIHNGALNNCVLDQDLVNGTIKFNVQGGILEIGDASGLETIEPADMVEATPVYYNLQGVRVANPTQGQVYIRVSGKRSEKVVF